MAAETRQVHQHSDDLDGKAVERLVFFSDAVIAIVITLIVLEVRLPPLPEHAGDAAVRSALAALWPKYFAVVLSFCVIGLFWMVHHRHFNWVKRVDASLVWANLLFLLAMACIPFATVVMAEHGGLTGTILYAAVLATTSLIAALLWWMAGQERFLGDNAPPRRETRIAVLMSLVSAAFFAGSIGIAVFSTAVAQWSWFLVFAANWLARKYYARLSPSPRNGQRGRTPGRSDPSLHRREAIWLAPFRASNGR